MRPRLATSVARGQTAAECTAHALARSLAGSRTHTRTRARSGGALAASSMTMLSAGAGTHVVPNFGASRSSVRPAGPPSARAERRVGVARAGPRRASRPAPRTSAVILSERVPPTPCELAKSVQLAGGRPAGRQAGERTDRTEGGQGESVASQSANGWLAGCARAHYSPITTLTRAGRPAGLRL